MSNFNVSNNNFANSNNFVAPESMQTKLTKWAEANPSYMILGVNIGPANQNAVTRNGNKAKRILAASSGGLFPSGSNATFLKVQAWDISVFNPASQSWDLPPARSGGNGSPIIPVPGQSPSALYALMLNVMAAAAAAAGGESPHAASAVKLPTSQIRLLMLPPHLGYLWQTSPYLGRQVLLRLTWVILTSCKEV